MIRTAIIGAFVAGLLAPAGAVAGDFTPPEGCEGQLTVQYRGCLMMNLWTCQGEPEGDKWMALFTDLGLLRLRKVDHEFQWLETHYSQSPVPEIMLTPAPDPASVTDLLADKIDTYEFSKQYVGQEPRRYKGFDRLTGATTVVSGETLLNTEYAYQSFAPDGTLLDERSGRQFIHPEFRIFLFGESAGPDGSAPSSHMPAEILRAGDQGFFADAPKYDCGAMLSSLPLEET
ncbi:hypothetical protein [Nereida sp. MMG025]|uniref:hypothetical protein n=1 Tax=Nereida sp. MMG025 TaxID=2909981 RepID=UPI001F46D721|nr:hypothetical protein [Nereida sp. MMG025]MCF6444538.1 hypothetical protein [Nereida sp. MMG025]